jgi:hypothetical protein
VTQSVLIAEVLALGATFNVASAIRSMYKEILKHDFPLVLHTDSLSLFTTAKKYHTTREKRLMVDIAMIREACASHEISDLVFVRSENNLADCLTNKKYCPHMEKLLNLKRQG